MADIFIFGLLAHLFADWFLQNDWQAAHKTNLLHPGAWVHFLAHLMCMHVVWAFGWFFEPSPEAFAAAIIVPVTHALIDTRKPLVWWRRLTGMKQFEPGRDPWQGGKFNPERDVWWNVTASQVAFWQDQAAHILVLGIAAIIIARFS